MLPALVSIHAINKTTQGGDGMAILCRIRTNREIVVLIPH